eukprot:6564533-Prymnesium_polylepis.1
MWCPVCGFASRLPQSDTSHDRRRTYPGGELASFELGLLGRNNRPRAPGRGAAAGRAATDVVQP